MWKQYVKQQINSDKHWSMEIMDAIGRQEDKGFVEKF